MKLQRLHMQISDLVKILKFNYKTAKLLIRKTTINSCNYPKKHIKNTFLN